MTALPRITNSQARALFLERHGLASPLSGSGRGSDLQSVVDRLGFVQLDTINTVVRAHHMILHARRPAYRPRNLHMLHDRDQGVFEHWTHDASMIAMEHFPYWRLKFRRNEAKLAARSQKWRAEGTEDKLDDVLRHIDQHGACCTSDLGADEGRSTGGWWDWNPSKVALDQLWRIGKLSVLRREGFRKIYDLTERVIPDDYLNTRPDEAQTIDWACRSALDRLGFATSGEIAAFWDLITAAEARKWCADALKAGDIIETEIELVDGRYRKSFIWPETLVETAEPPTSRLRILSPFDPALRDRNRAERLFGFFYRIEVFVPEAKRQYGYYVFPILEGDRLVGRIDMKALRDQDRLHVRALWPEKRLNFGAGRMAKLEAELSRMARLADVASVSFEDGWLRDAR